MTDIDNDTGRPYALVTGASSGIGYELARQFVANGFDVLMVAEDERIGAAAAKLDGDGHVEVVQVDLRDPNEVEQLWARITTYGRPVNAAAINAGVGNAGRFVETSLDDDLALIALNVASTVHLAKHVLSDMAAVGRGAFCSPRRSPRRCQARTTRRTQRPKRSCSRSPRRCGGRLPAPASR
jgi:uncharacterized protein